MKYETMLPGNPKPGDYKLTNISPYKIHQRCAEKFRVGRFLLAADAAHLCNPFGGLGLTGGMADAGNLADCIIGIAEGIADDSILDKYDEIRRAMWHNIINPVSSDNILRMHSQDPDKALENDEFLKMLVKAEKDPNLMEQMIRVLSFRNVSLMLRELMLFNMISLLIILLLENKRRLRPVLGLRRCKRYKIIANLFSFKTSYFVSDPMAI
jgi:2-polyprenyl-6-methoxyphenol hydroxylase-like FAD-dependent oxidoreductase